MKFIKLLTILTINAICFVSVHASENNKTKNNPEKPKVMKLQAATGDHNSTRSNRGAVVKPDESNNSTKKQNVAQLKPKKGRNPQTGKEINLKKRKGRNPQTGKEIKNTND